MNRTSKIRYCNSMVRAGKGDYCDCGTNAYWPNAYLMKVWMVATTTNYMPELPVC